MYVRVYVCMCVYVYVCVCVYFCLYVCMCVFLFVCGVYVYVYVCMCVFLFVCTKMLKTINKSEVLLSLNEDLRELKRFKGFIKSKYLLGKLFTPLPLVLHSLLHLPPLNDLFSKFRVRELSKFLLEKL